MCCIPETRRLDSGERYYYVSAMYRGMCKIPVVSGKVYTKKNLKNRVTSINVTFKNRVRSLIKTFHKGIFPGIKCKPDSEY